MANCRLRFYSLLFVFAANRIAALQFLRATDHVSCTSVTHERLVFVPAYASVSNNIGEVDIDGWLDTDQLNTDYDIDAYRASRLANDMFTTKADATVVEWNSEIAYLETGRAKTWLQIGDAQRLTFDSYNRITLLRRSNMIIVSVNEMVRAVVASSRRLTIGGEMSIALDSLMEWRPYLATTATLRSVRAGCLFFQANDKIDGLSVERPDGTSKMFQNEFTINKLELDAGNSVLNIIEREPDDDNTIIVFRTLYNCQNEILLPNNKEITGCSNITRSTWKSTPACACYACAILSCTCQPCQNVGKNATSETSYLIRAEHTTASPRDQSIIEASPTETLFDFAATKTTSPLAVDATEKLPAEISMQTIETVSPFTSTSISQTPALANLPDLETTLTESSFELKTIRTAPLAISPEKISPTKTITHINYGECLSCEINLSSPPITNFPTPAPSLESLTTTTLVVSTASATPAPATPTSAPAAPPPTKANRVNIAAGLGAFAVLVFFGYVCILFACKHLRRYRGGRLNNGEWDYNNGRETVQLETPPQPLPTPQPLAAVVSVQDETEPKAASDQPAAVCSPTVLNFDEAGQGMSRRKVFRSDTR